MVVEGGGGWVGRGLSPRRGSGCQDKIVECLNTGRELASTAKHYVLQGVWLSSQEAGTVQLLLTTSKPTMMSV